MSPDVWAALRGFYVNFRAPSGRMRHNVQSSNRALHVSAARRESASARFLLLCLAQSSFHTGGKRMSFGYASGSPFCASR